MNADPLSDFLTSLSTKSSFFAGLCAGGEWAISFPAPEGIKFNAVRKGSCWLTVEGAGDPVLLNEGDCFLLCHQRAFKLGSDPAMQTVDAETVYCHAVNGIARYGDAEDFSLISGRFAFNEDTSLISDLLPPLRVIRRGTDQAQSLHWSLTTLADELTAPEHGSSLIIQHLGHIMLVQALRLSFAEEDTSEAGLLSGLTDRRTAAVLKAIHSDPSRRWTLEDLADIACMSRSSLAAIFREKTGIPPIEYVLRWRMQLAGRELMNTGMTVSTLAQKLGYESDSAFSHAFRRVKGYTPREYRRKNSNKTED